MPKKRLFGLCWKCASPSPELFKQIGSSAMESRVAAERRSEHFFPLNGRHFISEVEYHVGLHAPSPKTSRESRPCREIFVCDV